jgi:hypothetical protein
VARREWREFAALGWHVLIVVPNSIDRRTSVLERKVLVGYMSSLCRNSKDLAPSALGSSNGATSGSSATWRRVRRHLPEVALAGACMLTFVRATNEFGRSLPRAPEMRSQVTVGEEILQDVIPWGDGEATVLLFVSRFCSACNESLPFFRRLARAVESTPSSQMIVVSQEATEAIGSWLQGADIVSDRIVRVRDLDQLGIAYVPTIIIGDRTGRVTDVAPRVLSPEEEETVLARVRSYPLGESVEFRSSISLISPTTLAEMKLAGDTIVLDPHTRREDISAVRPNLLPEKRRIVIECRGERFSKCASVGRELLKEYRDGVFAVVSR